MTGRKWPSGSRIEHSGTYVATTKPHDRLNLRRGLTFPKNSKGKPTTWELKDPGLHFLIDLVKHCLPALTVLLIWLLLLYSLIYWNPLKIVRPSPLW